MEKQQETIKKRKKTDFLVNLVSHIPLAVSVIGAPFLETLHNNEYLSSAMLNGEDIYQFTPRFLLGAGIMGIGAIIKKHNDDTQLKKICNDNPELLDKGAHSLIRHPTYLAQRIMSTGGAVMFPGIYSAGAFLTHLGATEYLARREEKTCELEYGSDYLEYKEKTPRWIPNLSNIKNKFRKIA